METATLFATASPPTCQKGEVEDLYRLAFPSVASMVSLLNGSFQDAKDVFQDAVIIYLEQSSRKGFRIETAPQHYILGIAKHLWIRKVKADRKKIALSSAEAALAIPADFFPSVQTQKLLVFLQLTGQKCMDLLRSFYYEKLSMKELAQVHGYSSEHSVTVQKYKCLEKMRDVVKQKSISYEDFFE